MKELQVTFWAALGERFGSGPHHLRSEAVDCMALWQECCMAQGIDAATQGLRVARNDEFVDWGAQIQTGDRIEFMPPFAGG